MMKKMLIFLLTALMLCLSTGALAETAGSQTVYLDGTTIIDGGLIYYSGSIDGGESGVYVMNADGSDARLISNITADLLALSGSNLLVYQYDPETGDASPAVLLPDGTLTLLEGDYISRAIAADGRFYWGTGSCAEDGGDVQIYFTGVAVQYYDYYPLEVYGDYLYYLDWSEMSDSVYSEGWSQPQGAALCRMDLNDYTSEVVSGVGTRFLGIENNLIYYTRDNFWREAEDGSGSVEVVVDQGLFCADLDMLSETRLAAYPEGDSVVDSYVLVEDGVVYGMHSDFSADADGAYSILRIQSDGTKLEDIVLGNDSWLTISCVEDGVLYAAESNIISSEDDFIQQDCVIAINLADGTQTVLNPDSIDMLFYAEQDPAVAVVDGRVYFSAYDMERWSVCLKSMNIDGSDLKLLAHGISYAEG